MKAPITTGFKALKKDRIHLLCSHCGRKQSNVNRDEQCDPKRAVVVDILCPRCCDKTGAKEPGTTYYSIHGKVIDWWKETK